MSVTEQEILVRPPSAPPAEPDPRMRAVDPADAQLSIAPNQSFAEPGFAASAAGVPDRPAAGAVVVEVEDATYVVRDLLGAVYGAGPSVDEARAEFEVALDDHLRFLREHYDALDARLQRQLALLERLFPGR